MSQENRGLEEREKKEKKEKKKRRKRRKSEKMGAEERDGERRRWRRE